MSVSKQSLLNELAVMREQLQRLIGYVDAASAMVCRSADAQTVHNSISLAANHLTLAAGILNGANWKRLPDDQQRKAWLDAVSGKNVPGGRLRTLAAPRNPPGPPGVVRET